MLRGDGSPVGSVGSESNLTGESLRRRPSHSRCGPAWNLAPSVPYTCTLYLKSCTLTNRSPLSLYKP